MIKKGSYHSPLAILLVLCLILGMSSFAYAEEEKPELKISEIEAGAAYDAELVNISESDFDYVIMKVWNEEEGDDEAVLYPAEWQEADPGADEEKAEDDTEDKEASWLAHILVDNHEETGVYKVVAYGVNVIEPDEAEKVEISSAEDITVDILSDEEMSTEITDASFEVPASDEADSDNTTPVTSTPWNPVPDILVPDVSEPETSVNENAESPEEEKITDELSLDGEDSASVSRKEAKRLGTPLLGIDVSHHNGTIDWAKVKKAGIKYVIIRCGYGDNYTSQDDKKWTYNVAQCEKLGIQYGVYIYSHATNATMAKSEADHCIRLLKGHNPHYPVYLDLEDEDQANLSNAKLKTVTVTWANKIKAAGYTPGVYSSKYWWTTKLTSTDYDNYSKWVAQWNKECTYTGMYHMWQYSSTGSVSGISGNVDMDYWYGNAPVIKPGWNKIAGKIYYCDENGVFIKGWLELEGRKYYFDTDGVMVTGWKEIDDIQYYFNTSGEMVTGWENVNVQQVNRLYGSTRYETSLKVADSLKKKRSLDKFSTIILASGRNFPDTMAGSYLSCVICAPILLVDSRQDHIAAVQSYINANLKSGGKIYLLGGPAVVPDKAVTGLSGYSVTRLSGEDRYETNLAILKEALKYSKSNEILVCSGDGFADSLSAAAVGKPILLVKDSLEKSQIDYLKSLTGTKTFDIIGGTGAVSDQVKKELNNYGTTTRIGGSTRYETSVNVAKKFFAKPESVVLAYGKDYPDGLCGGALAYAMNGPVVLTENGKTKAAEAYTLTAGMKYGAVLGGSSLISDVFVKAIYYMREGASIK